MDFTRKLSFFVFLLCVLISLKNKQADINRRGYVDSDSPPPLQAPPSHRKLQQNAGGENVLPEGIRYDYYYKSSPSAAKIIRSSIQELYEFRPHVAPALLRLAFHDCFVKNSLDLTGKLTRKVSCLVLMGFLVSLQQNDGVFLAERQSSTGTFFHNLHAVKPDAASALSRLGFHDLSVKAGGPFCYRSNSGGGSGCSSSKGGQSSGGRKGRQSAGGRQSSSAAGGGDEDGNWGGGGRGEKAHYDDKNDSEDVKQKGEVEDYEDDEEKSRAIRDLPHVRWLTTDFINDISMYKGGGGGHEQWLNDFLVNNEKARKVVNSKAYQAALKGTNIGSSSTGFGKKQAKRRPSADEGCSKPKKRKPRPPADDDDDYEKLTLK